VKRPPGVPESEADQRFFLERMLSDTGFFCRHVLGMDTDRDEHGNATGEVGKGGVRDYGPHQELVSILDDESIKEMVILAPRYSYKSSIAQGFVLRNILAHPDISILMFMHDEDMAIDRCRGIRDTLKKNPIIQWFFGDLEGPSWTQESFVTAWRKDTTLQSPTLWVATPDQGATGGRPNIVLFDDIVSDKNFKTELGLKKGRQCVEHSIPLASRGARYIDIGTPWHPADAHHWCMDRGWKRFTHLDSGFEVVEQDGALALLGEARWPNLSREHLMSIIKKGMTFPFFMSQFQLKVVSGVTQNFARSQFKPEVWRLDEHQDLSGFLLTDIAPSGSETSDLNVLMYVGLDERNHLYILDVEIGHWRMMEFCDRYLNMLQRWQSKVNHRREMWEKTLNYHSYAQWIGVRAKERNIRISIHCEQRNQTVLPKDDRIKGLTVRFQSGEINVMDTVPRMWQDDTKQRLLWDPDSAEDGEGKSMPGGDLVEQFVRWPYHSKKDLPDTLSLIDAMDKQTQARVCSWARPSRHRISDAVQRKKVRETRSNSPLRDGAPQRLGSAERFYGRVSR
jgi:hypothetical protein